MIKISHRYLYVSLLCSAPLLAQSQTGRTADEAESSGLQEVIVTAEKRSENLQEVPIAVTPFNSEQLEALGIKTLGAITLATPGLTASNFFSDAMPTFSLRGISSIDYNQNQASPVATYVDEVYKATSVLMALQMYDMDRVEVLHGPQGTLYGKNTTGGAVNLFSRRPSLESGFSGDLTVGLGNYDRREANGALNIPIVADKLAARVAFTGARADGTVHELLPGVRDGNSTDQWSYRLSAAYRATDRLNFLLRFSQGRSSGTTPGLLAADIGIAGPGGIGFATGYTREGLDFYDNESRSVGKMLVKNRSVSLTTTWDLSDAVGLTSVSSYDDGEVSFPYDVGPFDILSETLGNKTRSYAQDLRLASRGEGLLSWLFGAYYYHDKSSQTDEVSFYNIFAGDNNGNGQLDCFDDFFSACGFGNAFGQVRDSYAFYTQESYRLTDRVTLTGGVRYTKDKLQLDYYRSHLNYFDPALGQEVYGAVPIFTAPPFTRTADDNVGGKLGVEFKVGPQLLTYASISRGYRGAAINGSAIYDPAEVTIAPPERVDAAEIGLKSQWLENKLRVNTAAFYYDYRNQQFIDITPQLLQVLNSIPKSRIQGLELEVAASPVGSLNLVLGASYLDTEFRKGAVQGIDISGNRLTLAPKWTLNGAIDWVAYRGGTFSVTLHEDSRYTSRQFFNVFNTTPISEGGLWLHNARATLSMNALSVSAWVRNLAGTKYLAWKSDLASSFNFNEAQRGQPRQFGIEARYDF